MRKRVLLALVLVMALLASTGCNLIIKDEAVDRATPIIEVAGQTYTKGQINDQITSMLDYYAQMYSAYGMPFDVNDEQNIADIRDTVIDAYIHEAVIREKIAAGGYDKLSDEELAAIQAKVDEDYQVYYDSVELFSFMDTELEGEALTKAIEEEMVRQGYPTREQLLDTELLMAAQEKLIADTVKDVTVSDEEIATEYQARVDAAKASYEADPNAFSTDVSNGSEIYYTPAGYRYVKHVLISYSDEDQSVITGLQSRLASKETELREVNENLKLIGDDPSADSEEAAANRVELNASFETLTAEIADLTAQLDAAKAAADASIQPTVDEVAAKIAEGADFNALIEEYNTDPGMTAESIGYPVSASSTNWVESFQNASMALVSVGDISGAVPSSYGVHFIKYESDAAEGPVALETVKDALSEELLTTKQDAYYATVLEQWLTEAAPKVYTNLL